jgi:hypothetical protein
VSNEHEYTWHELVWERDDGGWWKLTLGQKYEMSVSGHPVGGAEPGIAELIRREIIVALSIVTRKGTFETWKGLCAHYELMLAAHEHSGDEKTVQGLRKLGIMGLEVWGSWLNMVSEEGRDGGWVQLGGEAGIENGARWDTMPGAASAGRAVLIGARREAEESERKIRIAALVNGVVRSEKPIKRGEVDRAWYLVPKEQEWLGVEPGKALW